MKRELRKTKTRLEKWKQRLERDRLAYGEEIARIHQRNAIYNGTPWTDSRTKEGRGGLDGEAAANVYNVAYELVEGQVDSNLPAPRVTAMCEADVPLAVKVEEMLRAKMDALPFEEFNDMDERTCYNQGGSYALVEWDSRVRRHSGAGDLRVSEIHPLQVIPQSGVAELEDMDYLFVQHSSTAAAIEKRYGKKVEPRYGEGVDARKQAFMAEEVLTVNVAYYKNNDGGIGRYTWVEDTELEALEDYEVLRVLRCESCGATAALHEKNCPECQGRKLKEEALEYEELLLPVKRSDGSEIPVETPQLGEDGLPLMDPVLGPDGLPQLDEAGRPVQMPRMEKTRIPRYRPGCFPLVLRRNVSKYGSLLGTSDIDVIRPQQDAIKKLTTNVMEKLLKGGSYVTLPAGVRIETSDRQLKVLRVENPAQKALIDVLNIQPNISLDMAALHDQYEKARSTLGITNSFQGKPDLTAQSGVAKQFAAAQSAGRLESKRRMKQAYYQRIFEMMFRFMLAYSDGPIHFKTLGEDGQERYTEFNRYDFLKQDAAGEWYWDDEFLFGVDATGGLAQNREAMWSEAERKYTSGAMGDPTENGTRVLYWTLLEQLQFPLAKAVRRKLQQAPGEEVAVVSGDTGAAGPRPMGKISDTALEPGLVEQLAGRPLEELQAMLKTLGDREDPVPDGAQAAGDPLVEQLLALSVEDLQDLLGSVKDVKGQTGG